MTPRSARRKAGYAAAAVFFIVGLWVFVSLGRWYQFSEEPKVSDLIMIPLGDPSRAVRASQLFKEGFAPEIWVGRDVREAYFRHLDRIGIVLPREEEIVKKALIDRGVPSEKIKFCGRENLSTLEEAQALRQAVGRDGLRIILVTSLYHTRRSKLIFGSVFPSSLLTAVADGDREPQFPWWAHKFVAEAVAKEFLATIYFELGGSRLNHRP
jgi:uncharacterized SAM-binding protein YcdF (DUF218 family)